MRWSHSKIRKTPEEPVSPITNDDDSPILTEYNARKDIFIKYARHLDYHLHKDVNEANELSKAIDKMFTHFIDTYEVSCDISQVTKVVTIYFMACFWIIDKYCHDEFIAGKTICKAAKINIKDLLQAEITLLNFTDFNIRQYIHQ